MSKKIIDLDALKKFRQEADQRYVVEGEYSPETKVGYADLAGNLDSKVVKNDVDAYIFRTSGGSLEIGDYCKEKAIVGGSLGWNQLVDSLSTQSGTATVGKWYSFFIGSQTYTHSNGETTTSSSSGTLEVGQITSSIISKGHRAFWFAKLKVSEGTPTLIREYAEAQTSALYTSSLATSLSTSFQQYAGGISNPNNGVRWVGFKTDNNVDRNRTLTIKDFMVVDLNVLLGTTIAEYIYTLESNHVGDGTAWLRKYFPKEYYACCNVGGFQSVKVSGKKNVGFNQFGGNSSSNPQYFGNYYIDSSANYVRLANANYNSFRIRVLPNTVYCMSVETGTIGLEAIVRFVDSQYNYIEGSGSAAAFSHTKGLYTAPTNAVYMEWCISKTSTANFCFNFHYDGERDGEYEPYEVNTYEYEPIDLIGIPKLDENSNLYFEGNRYNYDGTVDEEYEIVDLGTLSWGRSGTDTSGQYRFSATLPSTPIQSDLDVGVKSMLPKYNILRVGATYEAANTGYTVSQTDVLIRDANYNSLSAQEFKTAISGNYLIYKKATATQSSATPFQEVQKVNNWGTEEYIAPENDTRLVEVPVGHDTDYPLDCKSKIEIAPDLPKNDGVYVCKVDSGVAEYVGLSTWLSTNNYVKQEDLSSGITDSAGLTYSVKKVYKQGNIVTLTIKASNGTGNEIPVNTAWFSLPNGTFSSELLVVIGRISGVIAPVNISQYGLVSSSQAVASGQNIYIIVSYSVAQGDRV